MKKILILSSIVSLLILGCGSGGDSGDSGNKKTIDGALKIGDVAYSTPAGINFSNKMRTNLNKTYRGVYKNSFLNSKPMVEACSYIGTMSYEESDTEVIVSYNECIDYNEETYLYEYYNGSLRMSKNEEDIVAKEYWVIPNIDYPNTGSYMNLSMTSHKNGDINETEMDGEMVKFNNNNIVEDTIFTNLVMKEDSSNDAMYLNGSYTYKAGCINESYTFKTSEWLIPNSNNEDEYISGIITVNGMTYTYKDDKVTVRYGDKEGEFLQRELNEEMENKKESEGCNLGTINRE